MKIRILQADGILIKKSHLPKLHSLKQGARDIGLYANSYKTAFIGFNQDKWQASEISWQVYISQ